MASYIWFCFVLKGLTCVIMFYRNAIFIACRSVLCSYGINYYVWEIVLKAIDSLSLRKYDAGNETVCGITISLKDKFPNVCTDTESNLN